MVSQHTGQAVEKAAAVVAHAARALAQLDAVLRFEMAARRILGPRKGHEGGVAALEQGMDAVSERRRQPPLGVDGQRRVGSASRPRDGDAGARLVVVRRPVRHQQAGRVVAAAQKHEQEARRRVRRSGPQARAVQDQGRGGECVAQ